MESKVQSLRQAMGIVRESVLILPSNKNLAYLSFTQIKDYLDVPTGRGLPERNKKTMTYRTTLKGSEFPDESQSMKI